jgi:hypothetical protein
VIAAFSTVAGYCVCLPPVSLTHVTRNRKSLFDRLRSQLLASWKKEVGVEYFF